MELTHLHSKLKTHLKEQNKNWKHLIYSKQDGFYQGLNEIKIKGSRSSEKRFEEYGINKYLSNNMSALDIGSNCGFFSIFVSRFVKNILGVEINPYLVAIGNDTKNFLNISNCNFVCSSFEYFLTTQKFDLIFSLANDSTIDGNTKFNFYEYMEKIKNILSPDGLLIFESQAIDSISQDSFKQKDDYLKNHFTLLEQKKIHSEYPVNVPFRDFLILKNQM